MIEGTPAIRLRRWRDPDLVAALGGEDQYDQVRDEWLERIRYDDGGMPRNWMYHLRLYLEGIAAERRAL